MHCYFLVFNIHGLDLLYFVYVLCPVPVLVGFWRMFRISSEPLFMENEDYMGHVSQVMQINISIVLFCTNSYLFPLTVFYNTDEDI